MATKLVPDSQVFVDTRIDNTQVGITRVTLQGGLQQVIIPTAQDARLVALNSTDAAALPAFYLNPNKSSFQIDGGTSGTTLLVVSSHVGMVNFASETS